MSQERNARVISRISREVDSDMVRGSGRLHVIALYCDAAWTVPQIAHFERNSFRHRRLGGRWQRRNQDYQVLAIMSASHPKALSAPSEVETCVTPVPGMSTGENLFRVLVSSADKCRIQHRVAV